MESAGNHAKHLEEGYTGLSPSKYYAAARLL